MYSDFREFIEAVEAAGELAQLDGVDWELGLSTITEVVAEREDVPPLVFDYIEGIRSASGP